MPAHMGPAFDCDLDVRNCLRKPTTDIQLQEPQRYCSIGWRQDVERATAPKIRVHG